MLKTIARRSLVLLALAAAGAALAQKPTPRSTAPATPAAPLNWPTRPLRIIVGFPAGSTPDLVARTISEPLAKAIGQPVIVENRPGAGGNIAADAVVRATDNHTIGFMINGNMTIARMLNPAVPYDPQRDLQPPQPDRHGAAAARRAGQRARARMRRSSSWPRATRATSGATARPAWARWATSAWSCSRPRPTWTRCTCPIRATRR